MIWGNLSFLHLFLVKKGKFSQLYSKFQSASPWSTASPCTPWRCNTYTCCPLHEASLVQNMLTTFYPCKGQEAGMAPLSTSPMDAPQGEATSTQRDVGPGGQRGQRMYVFSHKQHHTPISHAHSIWHRRTHGSLSGTGH